MGDHRGIPVHGEQAGGGEGLQRCCCSGPLRKNPNKIRRVHSPPSIGTVLTHPHHPRQQPLRGLLHGRLEGGEGVLGGLGDSTSHPANLSIPLHGQQVVPAVLPGSQQGVRQQRQRTRVVVDRPVITRVGAGVAQQKLHQTRL
jgi:hypothetical protein